MALQKEANQAAESCSRDDGRCNRLLSEAEHKRHDESGNHHAEREELTALAKGFLQPHGATLKPLAVLLLILRHLDDAVRKSRQNPLIDFQVLWMGQDAYPPLLGDNVLDRAGCYSFGGLLDFSLEDLNLGLVRFRR